MPESPRPSNAARIPATPRPAPRRRGQGTSRSGLSLAERKAALPRSHPLLHFGQGD